MTITSTEKYRIVGEIGSGGMGIVYKAVQTQLDRPVAIKVLKPRYSRDPSFVQRFRQEARALAALPHTHIVQIYDVERVGDDLWIIMEWVDGQTLQDVLRTETRLDWDRARPVLSQCAAALAAAHSAGIAHLDVKPGNILLASDDTVKVMDFGVAVFLDPTRNLADDTPGSGMGSPRYMAPEQLAGERVDARADQFALALIAFEMLTGAFPFPGDDMYAIGYEKLHRPPIPLRDLWPEGPAHMEAALMRALARQPDMRFAGIAEFMGALDPPRPRPLPVAPFVVGALATMVLVAGGLWLLRPSAVTGLVPSAVPGAAAGGEAAPTAVPATAPDPAAPAVAALDLALAEADYERAELLLEEVQTVQPDHPRVATASQEIARAHAQDRMLSDAVLLYQEGALSEAKGMFRAILMAEPANDTARTHLDQIARRERIDSLLASAGEARDEGDIATAEQTYAQVLELDHENVAARDAVAGIAAERERAARLAMADAALSAGQIARARDMYQDVLADDPRSIEATRGLARVTATQEARSQFDASAVATRLRTAAGDIQRGVQEMSLVAVQHERSAVDEALRQGAGALLAELGRFEATTTDPLQNLASLVERVGSEVEAFDSKLERTIGDLFDDVANRHRRMQLYFEEELTALAEQASSEGGVLVATPQRLEQDLRESLVGAAEAPPVDNRVLIYRRPGGGFLLLGRSPEIEPVPAVLAELGPVLDAFGLPSGDGARATAAWNSATGVAVKAALADCAMHQRERDDLANASRNTLQERIGALLAGVAEDAQRASADIHEALSLLHGQMSDIRAKTTEQFVNADQGTREAAAALANDTARLHDRIERELARQQEQMEGLLRDTSGQQMWLMDAARDFAAVGTQQEAQTLVRDIQGALPTRAAEAATLYAGAYSKFEEVWRRQNELMGAYHRESVVVLRERITQVQQEQRNLRTDMGAWANAQDAAVRDCVRAQRRAGNDAAEAIRGWESDLGRIRAHFGRATREAFAEFAREVQRLQREVEAAQSSEGAARPLAGEFAVKHAKLVADAVRRYDASVTAAVQKAIEDRTKAFSALESAVTKADTLMLQAAATFTGAARGQQELLESGSGAIVERNAVGVQEFLARTRALSRATADGDA